MFATEKLQMCSFAAVQYVSNIGESLHLVCNTVL